MKVAHVVPHIDQEAAGPSYSVPRLCEKLAENGNDVELMCLASRGPINKVRVLEYKQWPIFPSFAISSELTSSMSKKSTELDIIHNHSLWSMINVASGWAATGKKAKFVNSPHGALSPWAMSHRRLKKSLFWPFQKKSLDDADLIHVTSLKEYEDVRTLGFKAPIAIIPNGIDLPEKLTEQRKLPVGCKRTLLFLGRIHPVKGVDLLLQAWKELQNNYPDWHLSLVGPGDPSYVKEMNAYASELNLRNYNFAGPVYGPEKDIAYFDSDIFILPTHSENFGIAVAEALAHGIPAIVCKGAPWQGLEENGCGWWIDNDVKSLVYTLQIAMQLTPVQRKSMGENGIRWMAEEFGWNGIAERMESSYLWLLNGGPTPSWIKVD